MSTHTFKPDFKKRIGSVTIDIYENCMTMTITNNDGHKLSYPEVIGAIEISRMNLINTQSRINMKAAKKRKD